MGAVTESGSAPKGLRPILANVFDSRDLPVEDRFAAWQHITADTIYPMTISTECERRFEARLNAAELGDTHVSAQSYASMTTRRTPRLIRQSDPETYAVSLSRRGRQTISQDGVQAVLGAGDLVVYSTSRPYDSVVDVRSGTASSVVAQIPRSDLPLPWDRVRRVMAVRLSGCDGPGRLLAGFLTGLATDTADSYRAADRRRLGGVLNDLVTAWLAHHIDATERMPVETRQRARVGEIQDFIRRNLGDADLTPAAVAAAHHMSPRSLHRLFHDHAVGATVACYIRDQRLARTRRDLADAGLATRPVHAIAARWGFPRPADFSRAFRAAYGIPPGEYRRRRLGGAGADPSDRPVP
jgi:AraC-like DNA-binding protein